MPSRDVILGRLRSARPLLPPPTDAAPIAATVLTPDECAARFAVEAAALGVEHFVERSAGDVQQRLASFLVGKRVLAWDGNQLPYGVEAVLADAARGDAARPEQAAAEIGVTGCHAAIAETASLVLFSGPGRSRTVSLLPPTHVAIVERTSLCPTMAEMFSRHAPRFREAAACTIITGPSRTADIELTLTLGIHGPGRVVVILGP